MKWYLKAVSMIEVMVALAVLSIGVVALVKFQSHMANSRVISSQQAEAVAIARDYIEQARHLLLISNMDASNTPPSTGSYVTVKENTTYNVAHTYTTNANPHYETLNVVVSWTDPSNVVRSIQLSTKLAHIDASKEGEVMDEL